MDRRSWDERLTYIPAQAEGDLSVSLLGGKGQALVRIRAHGIPVPEFYCVTTVAFRMSRTLAAEGTTQFSMPDPVRAAVARAHRHVFGPASELVPVAVRSSATHEDQATRSAAGQYESFLDIKGLASVLEAITECWASLDSRRAIAYLDSQPSARGSNAMAVVVQQMLLPRAAGVAFSVAPGRPSAGELLIEATIGLGDALVAGRNTPDQWFVDRETGRVLHTSRAHPAAAQLALKPEDVAAVAQVTLRLESLFGYPQDVEFALVDAEVWVLQSRAVTSALSPATLNWSIKGGRLWSRFGLGEWLQEPMSPMFETLCIPCFDDALSLLLSRRLGLRRSQPAYCTIQGFYYYGLRFELTARVLLVPMILARACRSILREYRTVVLPRYRAELAPSAVEDIRSMSDGEVLNELGRRVAIVGGMWAWIVITGGYARAVEALARWAYRFIRGAADPPYEAFVSGYGSASVDADDGIWRLAVRANEIDSVSGWLENSFGGSDRAHPQEERFVDWWRDLVAWHAKHGHRVLDLDISDQGLTLQDVVALVRAATDTSGPSPQARSVAAAEQREQAVRGLASQSNRHQLWGRRLLPLAQAYAAERENRPYELQHGWPFMREAALILGSRLKSRGLLAEADDVFFLTASELEQAVAGSLGASEANLAVIGRRRERALRRVVEPPRILGTGPLVKMLHRWLERSRPMNQDLVGRPASPGVARGKVRVVLSSRDFERLAPGEVLVTKYTTPAWTPVLSRAAAVVTEEGGTLSHAAIICREYGIPAVVGIRGLCQRLRDGDYVVVNGNSGVVRLRADLALTAGSRQPLGS